MAVQYIFSSTSSIRLSKGSESSGNLTVLVTPIKPVANDITVYLLCHACGRVLQSVNITDPYEGETYDVTFNVASLESSGHPGPYEFYPSIVYPPSEITISAHGTSVPPEGGTTTVGITYPVGSSDTYDTIHGIAPLDFTLWRSANPAPGWYLEKCVREDGSSDTLDGYKSYRIISRTSRNFVFTSYFKPIDPLVINVKWIGPAKIQNSGFALSLHRDSFPVTSVRIDHEGVYQLPLVDQYPIYQLYANLISLPYGISHLKVGMSTGSQLPYELKRYTVGTDSEIPGSDIRDAKLVNLYIFAYSHHLLFNESNGSLMYGSESNNLIAGFE